MRTTAYLKAIMEVYGKTITGLGPSVVNISGRPPAYANLMFTTQTDIIAQKSSSGQSVFYV